MNLKDLTIMDLTLASKFMFYLKAPGPGAFPSILYHNAWHLIKPPIQHMVLEFFQKAHSLRHINHTNIVLIPQKVNVFNPKDFCLISLCNVSYKIISKILATRPKPLLPSFISPMQSAFVHNQQISDNIIIAHEILHTIRTKNRSI